MMRKGWTALWACLALAALGPASAVSPDIFEAVSRGSIETVKALIESQPKLLRERNGENQTPLHAAVIGDRLDVAACLLERGAAVDETDMWRRTPLFYAAQGGNLQIVKLLISKGADVNSQDSRQTSILIAASQYGPQVMDTLLESGAVLPSPRERAWQALIMNSARRGLTKLFDRLTAPGADLRSRDHQGHTLLHVGAIGGNVDILRRLLAAGLGVGDRTLFGWTPLHFAAYRGHGEAASLLLEKGADINARALDGLAPYDLALEMEHKDVADLLAAKGADRSGPRFSAFIGDHFGQKPPGREPEMFGVGIVSDRYFNHGLMTFSPDGKEAYWAVLDYGTKRQRAILESKVVNGRWTPPRLASFSRPGFEDDVPVISPDGTRLFFMSIRPVREGGEADKENIWVMDRAGEGWSNPRPLAAVVNALTTIHHQMSVDGKGDLYFSAESRGGFGLLDLYVSRFEDGRYREPVNLGPLFNGVDIEFTPCIAPDGRTLLFSRLGPKGSTLLVSFRKKDATWTRPRDLGPEIRCPWEMDLDCPGMTRDGRKLFFAGSFDGRLIDSTAKVFWLESSFLDALRGSELKDEQ